MAGTSGITNPFGPVESHEQAGALARLSAAGFGLATVVSLVQALGVRFWADAVVIAERDGVAGFSIFLAVVTFGLALWQWKKPNRVLPIFGIAWALYELSAFMTSALVGAPLGPDGVPVWSPYLSVVGMAVCLVLHIGGVRGAAALGRFAKP
jgi:hypothetical protein